MESTLADSTNDERNFGMKRIELTSIFVIFEMK